MSFVQCSLKSDDGFLTTGWLKKRPRLRVGVKITLKDSEFPDKWWRVMAMGMELEKLADKRNWSKTNFNKKGGEWVSREWSK